MRLALLSDIHGNALALEAVLADVAAQGGVDGYWVLGDLVAIGPDPIGVLERLAALPNVQATRGNTDRYVVTGERPFPSLAETTANPSLIPRFKEVTDNFTWTQGALAATGWLAWLAALPLEMTMTLPDGTRLLGVHASPGTDEGHGIRPDLDEAAQLAVIGVCEADLICSGHTHWPVNRQVGNKHLVNLGSVSNPFTVDLRASYVFLNADEDGYTVQHRRVDYDQTAVLTQLEKVRHPSLEFIARFFRGDIMTGWLADHLGLDVVTFWEG